MCIGKMKKSLMLITSDFWVYELPLTSINHSINQLYLGDTKPQPISTKWPTLYHHPNYTRTIALQNFSNAYTVVDSVSQYVLFVTKYHHDYGVIYDMALDKVYQGFQYDEPEGATLKRVITTDHYLSYYAILPYPQGLVIRKWVFCNGYRHEPAATVLDTTRIEPICTDDKDFRFYRVCKQGSDQLYIETDPKKHCEPIKWPVYCGFVDRGQIYLLGANYVFTFPEKAYTHPGEKATYLGVPFGNFIRCHGEVHGRALEVTKSKFDHVDGAEPLLAML